jgi:uncharacterized protein YndB with AHSA1/START domain
MNKQIKHTWFFAHPTDVIWEYLTRSDLIGQWLMVNDFKPIVGHQFTFRSEACHPMAFDGNVYCEVLQVLPKQKLSYSWKHGPRKGEITLDSVVVWSLQPKNGGTELILEHTGFTEPNNLLDYQTMEPGWKGHVNRIQGLISTKYENAATIY